MLPLIWIVSGLFAFNLFTTGNPIGAFVVMALGYSVGKAAQTREGEDRLARKIRGD
jgi:hypothetical protein